MSKIKEWSRVGRPKILAENRGRRLIDQTFVNPVNGQAVDFTIFDSNRTSVVIFAMTTSFEIIAVKQFRQAIGEITIELPGGNIDPKDTNITEAAGRELMEETGYRIGELIPIPNKLWLDPGVCTPYIYSYLALSCEKIRKPKNEENENTSTIVLTKKSWMKMIQNGKISDMKTIAITLLATSILKKRGANK